MTKKIAILVRERQSEALRMAVGAILMDDQIEVFVLDRPVESSEQIDLYLETLADLDIPVYTNCRENAALTFLSVEEIAGKLSGFDHVIAY